MKKIIFSAALFVAAIGFANAQSEGTAKKCDKAKTEQCEKKCAKDSKKGCCKKDAAQESKECCKKDAAKDSKGCCKLYFWPSIGIVLPRSSLLPYTSAWQFPRTFSLI